MERRGTLLATAAVTVLAATLAGAAVAQPDFGDDEPEAIEEIVVTGTYLRRRPQAEMSSPISVIGQQDIQAIGAADIADITQTLTINNGAQNNPDAFTQNLTTATSNINLRGLGLSSTLVLLNGKRQVNSSAPTDNGILFVDTASLIPLIAIERTEIFKDGAAALYGSDAVGGVVNFITRDDFDGLELRADVQTNSDDSQTDLRLAGLWGGGNRDTRLTVAASYLHRSMLNTRERELRPEEFRGPGGLSVTGSSLTSSPGNLLPLTAPNPALDPSIAPIANLFNITADNATPLFAFEGIGTVPGTPVLADPSGSGFLVGDFAGFLQQDPTIQDPNDPASILAPSDGVQDMLTDVALGQALAQAPALLAQALAGNLSSLPPALQPLIQETIARLPNFNQAALSGQQQQMLQGTLRSLSNRVGDLSQAGVFSPFVVPDPACADFAAIDEDVFAPDPVTDPLTGQQARVGACQFDFGPFFALVPQERRIQGYAKVTHRITDQAEFYGEFGFARNRAKRNTSNFPTTSPLQILPNNPFNPLPGAASILVGRSPGFRQAEDFFTDRPNPNFFEHDTFRVVAGLTGDVGESWYYDVSFLHATNAFDFSATDGLAAQTNFAVNGFGGPGCTPGVGTPGTGPCAFFNPFGSGVLADPDERVPVFGLDGSPLLDGEGNPVTAQVFNTVEMLQFVTGKVGFSADSDLTVVDAVTSGDLFELPAGPVGVALGFQYRDVELTQDFKEDTERGNFLFVTAPTGDFTGTRDVYAVFGEANIPITPELEISAAVRFEDYGDLVGDTVDPRVGVLFRPVDWFSLRGTFSTSFRAPSVFQQFGNQTTLNAVIDPRDPTSQPFIAIETAGKDDLQPEDSTAFNVGFTAEPLGGLEINLDWWHFDFDDIVIQQQPEVVARQALCGPGGPCATPDPDFDPSLLEEGVVQLGVTGGLAFIQTEFINAAGIETNGFDASVDYAFATDLFDVELGWEGTYINKYEAPVGPGGAIVDVVDFRNSQNFAAPVPDLRFNASLALSRGGHSLLGFVRYVDNFRDDQNCGDPASRDTLVGSDPVNLSCPDGLDFARIDSHTTVDLQYNYTIESLGPFAGATFSLGSINLFDNDPPFVATDGAFESRTHDPRGRMIYVRLFSRF